MKTWSGDEKCAACRMSFPDPCQNHRGDDSDVLTAAYEEMNDQETPFDRLLRSAFEAGVAYAGEEDDLDELDFDEEEVDSAFKRWRSSVPGGDGAVLSVDHKSPEDAGRTETISRTTPVKDFPRGTATEPLILYSAPVPSIGTALQHYHLGSVCVRNRFGPRCEGHQKEKVKPQKICPCSNPPHSHTTHYHNGDR